MNEISVSKNNDQITVLYGERRLRAQILAYGEAHVIVADTQEHITVVLNERGEFVEKQQNLH